MGPLRHVLRGGARAPLQGALLRDREPPRRGGADAGSVPASLGAVGRDPADRGPTAYLFRVALNGFRMRRRRAAMAVRKVVPIPERRDAFLEAEMRADVRQLLLEVTPRQRAALLLVDLLGYPSEQAARILRVRPSTVRALATQGSTGPPSEGRSAGCLTCRRCSAWRRRRFGPIRRPSNDSTATSDAGCAEAGSRLCPGGAAPRCRGGDRDQHADERRRPAGGSGPNPSTVPSSTPPSTHLERRRCGAPGRMSSPRSDPRLNSTWCT